MLFFYFYVDFDCGLCKIFYVNILDRVFKGMVYVIFFVIWVVFDIGLCLGYLIVIKRCYVMLILLWVVNLGVDFGFCFFCGGWVVFVFYEVRKGSLFYGFEFYYEFECGVWCFFDFILWVMLLEEEVVEVRLRMG